MDNHNVNMNNIKIEDAEKHEQASITQINQIINDLLPNQTLYINNLNEKIKVDGIILFKFRTQASSFSFICSIW